MFSSSYVENQTITHIAGQWMDFKPVTSNGTIDSNSCTWTMPSYYPTDAVSNYATGSSVSSASTTPPSPLPTGPGDVVWYNTRSEPATQISVQCNVNDGGSTSFPLTAGANLGFETPTPNLTVTYKGPVQIVSPDYYGDCTEYAPIAMGFGTGCPSNTPPPGITWSYSITTHDSAEQQPSVIGLWQIVNYSKYAYTLPTSSPSPNVVSNCGDKNVPYVGLSSSQGGRGGTQSWNVTWYDADAPATGDLTPVTSAELKDTFDDYLMYNPPRGNTGIPSIWISLGHLQWGFDATTQKQGSGFATPSATYSTPGPTSLDTTVVTPSFPNNC